MVASTTTSEIRTLGDLLHSIDELLERLGGVDARRVLYEPPPGKATEDDLLRYASRDDRLYELVEGALVEKAVGYLESLLATALAALLRDFVKSRRLGLVTGADGLFRLFPGLVRVPDVAFVSWARVPGGQVPAAPVPALAPDLAVEIVSPSNTPGEMARKRREYFAAGVLYVWEMDPRSRTAAVYTGPDAPDVTLGEGDTLDGGDLLPGFTLLLRNLFAELDERAP